MGGEPPPIPRHSKPNARQLKHLLDKAKAHLGAGSDTGPSRKENEPPRSAFTSNLDCDDVFSSQLPRDSTDRICQDFNLRSLRHPTPLFADNAWPSGRPLQTNKFYVNLLLGDRNQCVFTGVYRVFWSHDAQVAHQPSLAFSHAEAQEQTVGPGPNGRPQYAFMPVGKILLGFTAAEFEHNNGHLQVDPVDQFSIAGTWSSSPSSNVTFHLVQGMAFASACYTAMTPQMVSTFAIIGLARCDWPRSGRKYRISFNNGDVCVVYVFPKSGLSEPAVIGGSKVGFSSPFSGLLQWAKIPKEDSQAAEAVYDAHAGAYTVGCNLAGRVGAGHREGAGEYSLQWRTTGPLSHDSPALMFALPHHTPFMREGALTSVKLFTPTSGYAVAVSGNTWSMYLKEVPGRLGFAPERQPVSENTACSRLSPNDAANDVRRSLRMEFEPDQNSICNRHSWYFSGKALARHAQLCQLANALGETDLFARGMMSLKREFAKLSRNESENSPLVYDWRFGGIVSAEGAEDPGADFGNGIYNDHHFHFGYYVYAAAIAVRLDASIYSVCAGWVSLLLRDFANPSEQDPCFPASRSFDWYNGHSWAQGITQSGDGKDEESSSEDYMSVYAQKLWGMVTGDKALEARAALQLAIMRESMTRYYMLDWAQAERYFPEEFYRENMVAGIVFMNKIDYATYFGLNTEYIHGIHMLPLLPISAYMRSVGYVEREWAAIQRRVTVSPASMRGWWGVLVANLGIARPLEAYKMLVQAEQNASANTFIDDGASLAYYYMLLSGFSGVTWPL